MGRWILPGIVFSFVAVIGATLLMRPGQQTSTLNTDLGVALIGGAIVAVAVLYLQERLSSAAEKRNLQLQLGLQDRFPGIDLSYRDLSGFHIPDKDFRQADLTGANLRGANLSGCNLQHASLNKADLRGAKLDETPLYPSDDLFPGEDLTLESIHKDVNHNGTTFVGARYDSKTRVPDNLDLKQRGAVQDESRWYRTGKLVGRVLLS